MTFKQTLVALSIASVMGLTGCAGMMGSSADDTQRGWKQFLEDVPTFEAQLIGDPGPDLTLDAIAGFAEDQHDALMKLNEQAETAGGQIEFTFQEMLKQGKVADREAYEKNLKPEEVKAWKAYRKASEAIITSRIEQAGEVLKAAAGVHVIVEDGKNIIARQGLNMLQGAKVLNKLKTAGEQAIYVKESMEWFQQIDAQVENAKNSSGQK